MKFFKNIKGIVIVVAFFALCCPSLSYADNLGEKRSFYVDSGYDLNKRVSLSAVLLKVTNRAYFYIDESWWSFAPQNDIYAALGILGDEFDRTIYPGLTSAYGQEWTPGIDKDTRITVLIHPMAKGSGGYFRSNDEYYTVQVPGSNEREMVYLNTDYLKDRALPSFLAHEFTHLIQFNQKNKIYSIDDDVWLNEMRAEYAPTLLGYDDSYVGSYLENRVQIFSEQPFNPITEWRDQQADYGVINIFAQYLVSQYGRQILIDSLHSQSVGIESLNNALQKNGYRKDFSQIFTDWTIAVYVNDCSLGQFYCFKTANLKNLRVYPKINFLPLSGQSILSVTEITKDWAGNWFKIIGGAGNVKLDFTNNDGAIFNIPYIIQKSNGSYVINFLTVNENETRHVVVSDFGKETTALIIIPFTKSKSSDFTDNEQFRSFTFIVAASIASVTPPANNNKAIPNGFLFKKNLGVGSISQDVVYLKILLQQEGCLSGVANTTLFASKTLAAVKCLQNKYKTQISGFAGYNIASTGYVGSGTRSQLNLLLPK